MRILHVVHDFLPNHVAGVEVYTDHLARHLARDHEVALLYSEVVPEAPNYSLRRGRHGPVRTYELVNNYRFRRFEETYRNAAVDRRVREVLDEFRPDVVHLQHLLNLSVGLVEEIHRRGIPAVMTLHDHWLACANGGQRFHRSLGRCDALDAVRCGSCTAHMNGVRLGALGLLRRRRATSQGTGGVLLLTDLEPARREAPRPEFVYRDHYEMGGRPGPTWVAHPPARLTFRVATMQGGIFSAAIAMHPDTFEALDPKRRSEDRHPVQVRSELDPGENLLELCTEAVPEGEGDYCTAGWIEPRVVSVGGEARALGSPLSRVLRRVGRLAAALPTSAQQRRIRQRWETMRRLAHRVDLFLAPSRYLGDELVRFGLPGSRVLHCDYGFATEGFRRREDLPERVRHFAFVGSLVPHKGVHVLLEAFQGMPHDARLELCGYPQYDPEYSARLESASRHPGVRFLGGLNPQAVPDFLREVDCLVVPSIWQENSPLTVHEAFLAGVPVVASRLGGHEELLAEGGGLLYDADTPAHLRAQLRRLYDEPGLARRLAASAPAVKPMSEHVLELLAFYERLLAGKGGSLADS
jgi:glycosyltransferase involved in cell wall biosynthesis